MNTIELNLEKDVLEGWEPCYDILNVKALRLARKQGCKFPLVDTVFEEGVYRLAFGADDDEWENYGGHSRAVLALQDRFPLECKVLDKHRQNWKNCVDPSYTPARKISYIPIQEMQPRRMTGWNSLSRLAGNLEFLPDEIRRRFIEENSLVVSNGNLIDKQDYLHPPAF